PVFLVGSGCDRARGIHSLAVDRAWPRGDTLPGSNRIVPVGLSGASDFQLPLYSSAVAHHLPSRPLARDPVLHALGFTDNAANHSRLCGVRLLGLRRKAARRRRLSLKSSANPDALLYLPFTTSISGLLVSSS